MGQGNATAHDAELLHQLSPPLNAAVEMVAINVDGRMDLPFRNGVEINQGRRYGFLGQMHWRNKMNWRKQVYRFLI